MKFMMIVKANKDSEAGAMPDEKILSAMARYNEELTRAGVLLDLSGLAPSSQGARIRFSAGGKRAVVDGPFTEAKELVAGFYLIDVKSPEEAIEWARRCPIDVAVPPGADWEAVIEVRRVAEPAEVTSDTEHVAQAERFRLGRS